MRPCENGSLEARRISDAHELLEEFRVEGRLPPDAGVLEVDPHDGHVLEEGRRQVVLDEVDELLRSAADVCLVFLIRVRHRVCVLEKIREDEVD